MCRLNQLILMEDGSKITQSVVQLLLSILHYHITLLTVLVEMRLMILLIV